MLIEQVQPIKYKDSKVFFLDQTLLPEAVEWIEVKNAGICRDAIRRLAVRGAPAIGIAAAYGMLIAARAASKVSFESFYADMIKTKTYLASSRPTAVNLFWALDRIDRKIQEHKHLPVPEIVGIIENEAIEIQHEDEDVCRRIGEHGQSVIKDGMGILTHCNAGSLAASKYGTALAPIYVAAERGLKLRVYADETRPLLQGARLTAYELSRSGIDVTLITDNMAAVVMRNGWVGACIVGCDRVASNGDTANKIGTYGVALLAKAHGIPFYVACPSSTFDSKTASGADIPIEERGPSEVTNGGKTAPPGVKVYNPAFDVTPHELITAFITENGVVRPDMLHAVVK